MYNNIQHPKSKMAATEDTKNRNTEVVRTITKLCSLHELCNALFLGQKVDYYIFMNVKFYYESTFRYLSLMGKFTKINEK